MKLLMRLLDLVRDYRINLLNIVIRSLTLASKFLLIVLLARELTIEQFGIYGLFVVSVSYGLYIIGLDYYSYTTRELLSQSREYWGVLLRDQAIFYIVTYCLALPFFLILFSQRILPWSMLLPFYGLITIEHISQELYRLLITLQKPIIANIVHFLRLGGWVYAVFIYAMSWNLSLSLNLIFVSWGIGGLLSIVIALHYVYGTIDWDQVWSKKIEWSVMLKGLKISSRFLVSTLCLKALFTLDRYFIEWYVSTEAVGVYTFYASLVNGISAFIDAGVIVFQYPLIIKYFKIGDMIKFNQAKKTLNYHIWIGLIILCSLSLICIEPLIRYIAKDAYLKEIHTYYWLLGAIIFLSFSSVPHYELYAKNKDTTIMVSSIVALIVFCICSFTLLPLYGSEGVAMALMMAMGMLLFLKLFGNSDLLN
jgi:O-antigen/teichoic acid export membrane protein